MSVLDLFSIPEVLHQEGPDHMVTGTERKTVIENITLQINSKRSAGNEDIRTFTIDLFVTHGSEKPCWNWKK